MEFEDWGSDVAALLLAAVAMYATARNNCVYFIECQESARRFSNKHSH
jgi:hypothetical protein